MVEEGLNLNGLLGNLLGGTVKTQEVVAKVDMVKRLLEENNINVTVSFDKKPVEEKVVVKEEVKKEVPKKETPKKKEVKKE